MTGFTPNQFSNEPFPSSITAHESVKETVLPSRIRTSQSDLDNSGRAQRYLFLPLIIVKTLPVLIVISIVLAPFIFWMESNGPDRVSRPSIKLRGQEWIIGSIAFLVLVGVTYPLAVWPRVLRDHCRQHHRQLFWEDSIFRPYVDGISDLPGDPLLKLVVDNGTASSIDLYADGSRVDRVPMHGIRVYGQSGVISQVNWR